jgi:hypothetical protein
VECIDDNDCPGGCDVVAQVCIECNSDAHCAAPTPACNTSSHICVECLLDAHCSGDRPLCDTASSRCYGCTPPDTLCGRSCVNLSRDDQHCGACDVAVPRGGGCYDGVPGCGDLTRCDNVCADLLTDNANCGACGQRVAWHEVCREGSPTCSPDYSTRCDDECVDLRTDRNNCGRCGNECPHDPSGTYVYDCERGSCERTP